MSPRDVKSSPQTHGDVLTSISKGMVVLLKEFYGRGPTRAKTYYEDDLVVCLLRGGYSRVEQTLLEGVTHRSVIGFMSGNQQDPDIMCELFILAPTDLLDDHEIPGSGPTPRR